MDLKLKQEKLFQLYAQFEEASQPYVASAVCRVGCADCCTNVGNVDITTLEGVRLLAHIRTLPPKAQKTLSKKLRENSRARSDSKYARCAFLSEDNTCSVYAIRPFSCRRLYSVRVCGETGPTVHRQVWTMARETEKESQLLDDDGCSGHMPQVLALLKDASFLKGYLKVGLPPRLIQELAKKYCVSVNRYAQDPPGGSCSAPGAGNEYP